MGGVIAVVGLAAIEPLAGAGFAMCLAYLALDRFRYRKEIETYAKRVLDKYDAEGDGTPDLPPALMRNETVNELQWLCRKECNGFAPKGFKIAIYRFFYRKQGDVIAITGLGTTASAALAIGVALGLSRWQMVKSLDSSASVALFFYICLLALALPPLSIALGRHLTKWCIERTSVLDKQIADMMTLGVGQAQAPPLPQGPSQTL